MSIHRFPLKTAQIIRHYIHHSLTPSTAGLLTTTEEFDAVDIPEPNSVDDLSDLFGRGGFTNDVLVPAEGSWVVSTVNPAAALIKLPGLQLKSGFRLVSYLYRAEAIGVGAVWAVPEATATTATLEKIAKQCASIDSIPHPPEAIVPIMAAIEGDRSPLSFLAASLFRREVQEFGALGDRRNWSHHRLIDAIPTRWNWQWSSQPPKDLLPKVKITEDGQGIVEFFFLSACSSLHPLSPHRSVPA
ncbi:MAG: hypothetical protein HC881_05215 [Leptolyngbyaceae cyanobacterium SL_7_1]|nr:hypothetical protein [Leptolyngbyaceae cyanobacterium SL_7_1]